MTTTLIAVILTVLFIGVALGFILASMLAAGKIDDNEADSERLDFIQQNGLALGYYAEHWALVSGVTQKMITPRASPSLREAIDNGIVALAGKE